MKNIIKQLPNSSFWLVSIVPALISQPVLAEVVQVTSVQLKPTDQGLELIWQTASEQKIQVFTTRYGDTLVIDVINTQLAVPQGNSFSQANPVKGIAFVTVTQLSVNSIRVRVTGTDVSTAQMVQRDASGGLRQRSLVLSLTPVAVVSATGSTPQQPQQSPTKPEEILPQQSDDLTQKPVETEQTTSPGDGNEDIEVVVTGEQEGEYKVPNTTTATKTDTPLRDIPQSIQSIPRQVIEDRQVVRFSELAENVSGVQAQSGYGGLSSQGYYLRGFPLEFESFRNGFRDFGFISPRDVANVERVDFLKGPASVLYGGGSGFSGLVNTVTKKPQAEPR
ncbi:MAG TPA: TonB-dependent receptor plug domain-containing protein [Leptolyngbyaceae cyanobacterium]